MCPHVKRRSVATAIPRFSLRIYHCEAPFGTAVRIPGPVRARRVDRDFAARLD
jgi:hypothetical protein